MPYKNIVTTLDEKKSGAGWGGAVPEAIQTNGNKIN
jgi:hypothetical protein